jgi:enamine deaminase RidA (YjgF/YER057c/UK114 family)
MVKRIDIEGNGRLCNAAIHGRTVYLAGQVPEDGIEGAEAQTASVLESIDEMLAKAGTDKSRILSALCVLADISDGPAMNRAWDAWVDKSNPPARATIEGKLFNPAWRVEIIVTAALPD